mgnify:CR=1 FL=1
MEIYLLTSALGSGMACVLVRSTSTVPTATPATHTHTDWLSTLYGLMYGALLYTVPTLKVVCLLRGGVASYQAVWLIT